MQLLPRRKWTNIFFRENHIPTHNGEYNCICVEFLNLCTLYHDKDTYFFKNKPWCKYIRSILHLLFLLSFLLIYYEVD